MKLIRGIHGIKQFSANFDTSDKKSVACILGNFDGVHLGHQALLTQLKQAARKRNIPCMSLFFEPHADEFFKHEKAKPRLMTYREKIKSFAEHGLDYCGVLKFDESLRSLTADDFLTLLQKVNPAYILVGNDFRFGEQRTGDIDYLLVWAEQHQIDVKIIETVELHEERISSTRIRNLLEQGDFELAQKLLGKPWSYENRVIYGQALGRKLGFPTANMALHRYVFPVAGVFAGKAHVNSKTYNAVANVGTRPTLSNLGKKIMEVHLLDFDQMVYGKRLKFDFVAKLRAEKKFPSLDHLKIQILDDVVKTKSILEQKV